MGALMGEPEPKWHPPGIVTLGAECPRCGEESEAPAHKYLLWCCSNVKAGRNFYTFTCTRCGEAVSKPTDLNIEGVLVAGGVPRREFDLPQDFIDRPVGPAITYDDVLDLHLALHAIEDGVVL